MAEGAQKPASMRRKPRQTRSQERVNRILDVAERLFVEAGYGATTTNAIATQAQVSIGSLYQFFPDKGAILQALALRYGELLHQRLRALDAEAMIHLPLADYVERIVETTSGFFDDYPGYYAIFMEVQGTVPELDQIETDMDAQLIAAWAIALQQRDSRLTAADGEAIAFVLVKAIGTLLWLSLGQEKPFKQRLIAETKRLTLSYLQSYFS